MIVFPVAQKPQAVSLFVTVCPMGVEMPGDRGLVYLVSLSLNLQCLEWAWGQVRHRVCVCVEPSDPWRDVALTHIKDMSTE